MENFKKQANKKFFIQVIKLMNDGGIYVYPAAQQKYVVRHKKLHGSKKAIDIIKQITPKDFHSFLVVKEDQ